MLQPVYCSWLHRSWRRKWWVPTCISVAERGTWPWIQLSWSLLTKQHGVYSTQSCSRFLQVGTPCGPFFVSSSQIAETQSFESSQEFGLTLFHGKIASRWNIWPGKLDWQWCHEKSPLIDPLTRFFLCSPNGPHLLTTWMADTLCHCLAGR
jgi:hypothetical protein